MSPPPLNQSTRRVFVAATRQNDGKTTTSLGLIAAIQQLGKRVGYIKPVGQRFVEIEDHKIDEDTVLMDQVFRLNCPLIDMSPIAVEPDFTRRYLEASNYEALVNKIQSSFNRVAWEKDFVLCEGSGHAGVGSVFDLSNAAVARILGSKAILVSQGGIGRPIDEVALNQALFQKEGVEIIGVILNKVLEDKLEYIADFARRGLRRRGLELLGVLPLKPILARPSMESVRDELHADHLNPITPLHMLITRVVVGAMGAQHVTRFFMPGSLLITPGDREDIILAAAAAAGSTTTTLSGMILTDKLQPTPRSLLAIRELPFPVLLADLENYQVASLVHDLIVKTKPADIEKIALIRDLIAKHVDVARILQQL